MGDSSVLFIKSVQVNDLCSLLQLVYDGVSQETLDSGLCWAARNGNLELVMILIDHGANPDAEVWGGFTPLILAAMFADNLEVLRYLIQIGSDVNRFSRKRRQTALHAAVIRGSYDHAEMLLEGGAHPDVQDFLYKTPLLHAVHKQYTACVKLLIKYNCNVDLTGWVNGTSLSPLLLALLQNDLESTKMLVLAGAKFERTTIYQTYTITQYYETVEEGLDFELRPVYLQQQCRVCIRSLLKPDFLEKLARIDLPVRMKEYLRIAELDY